MFDFGSIPLSWLAKLNPIGWVTKKLFYEAYKASHDCALRRYRLGSHWKKLGEHVEYDTFLNFIRSNEDHSLMAVRSTDEKGLRKVKINIKVNGSGVDYQDTIEIFNLGNEPTMKMLPNIPKKELWVEDDGIYSRYKDVYTEIVELVDQNGENLLFGEVRDHFKITHTECLNYKIVYRWGRYWNLDELEFEKNNLALKYEKYLIFPYCYGEPRYFAKWYFQFHASSLVVAAKFWSRNLICGKQIKRAIAERN